MANEALTVYTIGHSDHPLDEFIEILNRHEVTALVDVRSQPYSRWAPQFNREDLACSVEDAGIRYQFMGDLLGGRPQDQSLYAPGEELPDYERIAGSPPFMRGVETLVGLAQDASVAIMCSEGDYSKCHRHHLITPALLRCDVRVVHIRRDASLIEVIEQEHQLGLF
jgi:uncharacterized protein (DUF488 family)